MSAESHLAKFGITIQQANDFIKLNLGDPKKIYSAAIEYGVTVLMLGEITDYSTHIVRDYFHTNKLDTTILSPCILINSNLGAFEHFVAMNNRSGILSTASLEEKVKSILFTPITDYEYLFSPESFEERGYPKDGIYDEDELGVKHLGNIAATNEAIKSLFYGTFVNMFLSLDSNELSQIERFPNPSPEDDTYQALLSNALNSPPSIPWTDEALADHVAPYAATFIDNYYNENYVGILDNTFLGLSVY